MNTGAQSPVGLKDRVVSAGLAIGAVALLIASRSSLSRLGWLGSRGESLFALGFLLLAGTIGGRLAGYVGLPRLTGYLAVGVVAGPHAFAVFGTGAIKSLDLINSLALALIALQAGAEFTADIVKRSAKSVLWSTGVQTFVKVPLLCLLFVLLAQFFDFGSELDLAQVIAVGAVWGAISLSKSPAAVLDVLSETRSKGPLSEHVLGVVVVLDVLVLVLFSVALTYARASLLPNVDLSLEELRRLGTEIFASIAAGTTIGLLISAYFWLVRGARLLFLVVAGYGITAACTYLHYDVLLVFVVAGFVATNLTRQGPALIEATERLSTGVMVVFFATAGAKLDLAVLRDAWLVAFILVVGRAATAFLSCRIGHRIAKDPKSVETNAHLGFISQAGITIGFAALAAEALPGIGAHIATLTIAVVGINQVIGPVLFKVALANANEIGKGQESSHLSDVVPDPDATIPPVQNPQF